MRCYLFVTVHHKDKPLDIIFVFGFKTNTYCFISPYVQFNG